MKRSALIGAGARALDPDRRLRRVVQARPGWPRGQRNPRAMGANRAWLMGCAYSLSICLLALRRFPDGPKGPNLSRAAQDAVLLLLGRDPLDGQTFLTMRKQMEYDRETLADKDEPDLAVKIKAARRLEENRQFLADIDTLYKKRLRRDPHLVAHVQWLRGRRELRPVLESALERLLDAELLPNSG
ncbi:MAG: hypothetical protein U9R07_14015 [Pseudomonadota bacterium]|nr:hypothetical protein [Pseudomonadota bacterium]